MIEHNIKSKPSISILDRKSIAFIMKFPNMGRPWDSRFNDFVGQHQHEDFRKAYSAKVRPHWEAQLTRLQNSLKKKKRVVSNNQWFYAAANAHISNGATEARCTLV